MYFGYALSSSHLWSMMDKIHVLMNCPTASTKKQVQQFLGLARYYQHFVSWLATIIDFLKRPHKIPAPQETCNRGFKTLKDCLNRELVLLTQIFEKHLLLQTNALGVGLWAVLSQMFDVKEHPILYISRKLFPVDEACSVIEKKTLAVRWAMDSICYYLWGNLFSFISDYRTIKVENTMKETNSQITLLCLSLQPYKFQFYHQAGKTLQNTIFFSCDGRIPLPPILIHLPQSWRGGYVMGWQRD